MPLMWIHLIVVRLGLFWSVYMNLQILTSGEEDRPDGDILEALPCSVLLPFRLTQVGLTSYILLYSLPPSHSPSPSLTLSGRSCWAPSRHRHHIDRSSEFCVYIWLRSPRAGENDAINTWIITKPVNPTTFPSSHINARISYPIDFKYHTTASCHQRKSSNYPTAFYHIHSRASSGERAQHVGHR